MLREIIRPTSDSYSIHIPKEYINTDVEILVLPFSYEEKKENISKSYLRINRGQVLGITLFNMA